MLAMVTPWEWWLFTCSPTWFGLASCCRGLRLGVRFFRGSHGTIVRGEWLSIMGCLLSGSMLPALRVEVPLSRPRMVRSGA